CGGGRNRQGDPGAAAGAGGGGWRAGGGAEAPGRGGLGRLRGGAGGADGGGGGLTRRLGRGPGAGGRAGGVLQGAEFVAEGTDVVAGVQQAVGFPLGVVEFGDDVAADRIGVAQGFDLVFQGAVLGVLRG